MSIKTIEEVRERRINNLIAHKAYILKKETTKKENKKFAEFKKERIQY